MSITATRLSIILFLVLVSAQVTLQQYRPAEDGIRDIESIKKELRDPYRSGLEYAISGLRGFRDGYFSEYHHGKVKVVDKDDAKCLSAESEK
jgi:hypothetical protein